MAMNALELQLTYPFGEALPALGTTLEVAPGVRWLRMVLPFQLDHINLWLLRDALDGRAGWTIVDCGITNDATRAAWEQIFAAELEGLPVLRVIVTHMHPDHMGLAHWLTEKWGVRLWVSATDYSVARMASGGLATIGGEATAKFMASHGLTDADAQAKIRARTNYYASMVPALPPSYRRMMDGDVIAIGGHDWQCHAGYGHAPEHISLHCPTIRTPEAPSAPAPVGNEEARIRGPRGAPELGAARLSGGVLISGDMVLPRISTNVSVHEGEPEANPLMLYLASIKRMKALPEDTLVLPSHGRPFRGLHTRVDQLTAHHDERFADVLRMCAEAPQHAAALLPILFRRPLDLHQTTFAMGESVAHLHALWLEGRLARQLGDDGIFRFTATA